jgi:predicted nuclease of predicted toxin-antitoxin system
VKLICDMDFSPAVATGLAANGHDAYQVADVGPPNTTDEAILERARNEGRVPVTFDRGIVPRLARTGAASPSVINVIVEDRSAEAVLPVVLSSIAADGPSLQSGAVVIYRHTGTRAIKRVRPLPLILR